MTKLIRSSLAIIILAMVGFAQIDNVQFTDLQGRSFDLYEELDKGRYIYIYFTWNG